MTITTENPRTNGVDTATLRGIVEQSRRRSAVYDVLTQPTPVAIEVVTG
jgi:hypothetical protein